MSETPRRTESLDPFPIPFLHSTEPSPWFAMQHVGYERNDPFSLMGGEQPDWSSGLVADDLPLDLA